MLVLLLMMLAAGAWSQAPTPLSALLAEARAHNPGLQAADRQWRAAQQAVAPAGALPDPQLELQQMNAGSPLPFAGYSSVEMTYVGVAAMQSLPYPGKLRLRAEVARRAADVQRQTAARSGRSLARQVTEVYVQLGLLAQQQRILEQQRDLLQQAEQVAELHFRTAQGPQADVLAAQLQLTELLRDAALLQEQSAAAQAEMRSLLNRPPTSPSIVPEALHITRLIAGEAALLANLTQTDPVLAEQQARVSEAGAGAALAKTAGKPDFTVQLGYQHTASAFPDRYMVSVGMSLPWLHRNSRVGPALQQAVEEEAAARAQLAQLRQEQRYRLIAALLTARRDEQILHIDEDGALPQARAGATAALTAYANHQGDLESYLQAWQRGLAIEQQYWQTVAEHETALATVAELTGGDHD